MTDIDFIQQVLAEQSAYVLTRHACRREVSVSSKGDANDLLTEVDLAVQTAIVARIAAQFPGDKVMAEEGDYAHAPENIEGRCWILDPIDGTQNFVRSLFGTFGISLGLAVGDKVVAGGVAFPVMGETFVAERGSGAFLNGQRQRVSDVAEFGSARVEVDYGFPNVREETFRRSTSIVLQSGQVRCHGAAVVGLCSIAMGAAEAFFHVALNPWDYAAGQVIVEEAGGKTSRFDGSRLRPFDARPCVLATNGVLHETMLALIDD